jgi:aspartate aminotransferase-like enzyme
MYFDWRAHKKAMDAGSTPWTPAVNLFQALDAAFGLMRAEGLEALFARHERLARFTREALRGLGLQLVADPRYPSPTVTTAYVPPDVDAKRLRKNIRERHDVVLAGGQGQLEGQIVRIGHMGWVDEGDLSAAVRALEIELTASRAREAGVAA